MGNSTAGNFVSDGTKFVKVQNFGQALRLMREGAQGDFSYKDVANKVGCTKSEARDWELNKGRPSKLQLSKLMKCFPQLRYFAAQYLNEDAGVLVADSEENLVAQGFSKVEPPQIPVPEPPKTFAEALRRARVSSGLDLGEVAELIDLDVSDNGTPVSVETILSRIEAHSGADLVVAEPLHACLVGIFPELRLAPKPTLAAPKVDGEPSGADAEAAGVAFARALSASKKSLAAYEEAKKEHERTCDEVISRLASGERRLMELNREAVRSKLASMEAQLALYRAAGVPAAEVAEAVKEGRRLLAKGFPLRTEGDIRRGVLEASHLAGQEARR